VRLGILRGGSFDTFLGRTVLFLSSVLVISIFRSAEGGLAILFTVPCIAAVDKEVGGFVDIGTVELVETLEALLGLTVAKIHGSSSSPAE